MSSMHYYPTTETVQADGQIYAVLRRKRARDDGKTPPVPEGSWLVVARRDDNWILGTFRPDGRLFCSCSRSYGDALEPMWMTQEYENA